MSIKYKILFFLVDINLFMGRIFVNIAHNINNHIKDTVEDEENKETNPTIIGIIKVK